MEVARGAMYAIVFLRDNITKVEDATEEHGERWQADEYQLYDIPWTAKLAEKITESFAAYLERAKNLDYARAADTVRVKRNMLLSASDARMALDRLGMEVPSGSTFTAWLVFLKKLGDALVGSWAKYRQALRDITQQPGFPYDVNWPDEPGE